jgi:phospholipid-binding lipoprotein MlaA
MKHFLAAFLICSLGTSYAQGFLDEPSPNSRNCPAEEIITQNQNIYDGKGFLDSIGPCPEVLPYGCGGLFPSDEAENNDPFEPINRIMFSINQGIEYVLLDPIAGAYSELVPKSVRDNVSNVLRNLNEPIVLTNNLLQGDLEGARDTIWRFIFNTTIGVAGIFDAAEDMGIPYKKQDLGLTFASWGVDPGPYLILPILGPSTLRDAWGRVGDYVFDPINWVTFGMESAGRSCVQVLDAKTDNFDLLVELEKSSVDFYASLRSWYMERRKALSDGQQCLDSPRPDEDSADEENADEENTDKDNPDEDN